MTEKMIVLEHVTKDYGQDRGLFDLNLTIKKGEVFGLVGVNGAGKTTTLRLLMGFIKAQKGDCTIAGLNTWRDAAKVKQLVGYVPGEIAFPDTKSGQTFLKLQLELLHELTQDNARVNELIQKLKIDTTADIKRMSKGMKQKVALVCAFMTQADVLLLDEPTTGLDPVMRDVFIELIKDAKKRGTTIIMSSHMFNELEPTCDRIAFLKNGRVIELLDKAKMADLRRYQRLDVTLADETSFQAVLSSPFKQENQRGEKRSVSLIIYETEMPNVIALLGTLQIENLSIQQMGLDSYFAKELA